MPNEFSGIINNENKPTYEEWKENVNNHPAVVENNDKIVNKSSYVFWKVFGIFGLIIFIIAVGSLCYLIYEGKLTPVINNDIKPFFNATINNNNEYSFNPSTTNNIKVNVTVINVIGESNVSE